MWINSAVYAAAVLEYLVSEVLDLSGTFAIRQGKKLIQPNHINIAMKYDNELHELTKNTTLPGVTNLPK